MQKGARSLNLEKAVQLPLEVWQDPQGDVIMTLRIYVNWRKS
jgi:hypothetical protein